MVASFMDQLLAPLPSHEVPADSAAYRHSLAIMFNIERYAKIVASRPNYEPKSKSERPLRIPACSQGCAKCFMECAIAPSRLEWWENELAKTEGRA